jgi:uncharacterized protein (TIGR02266 family)
MNRDNEEVKINRRQDRRISVTAGVTMSSDSNIFVGLTDDISEGGIFVATYDVLPVGRKIDLEVSLPGQDAPICAQAEVRWHRSVADPISGELVGFGAKFFDISDSDQERLRDFIMQRDPLFHPE